MPTKIIVDRSRKKGRDNNPPRKRSDSSLPSSSSPSSSSSLLVPPVPPIPSAHDLNFPHVASVTSHSRENVYLIEFSLPTIDRILAKELGTPERSKGIHVSSIIRDAATMLGIIKPDVQPVDDLDFMTKEEIRDPMAVHRICAGLAWEQFIFMCNPHWVCHPGEFDLDGIVGSPDAIWTDYSHNPGVKTVTGSGSGSGDGEDVVVEIKFTWKSMRNPDFWMWEAQIKAYCKLLGIWRARLAIYHVNGDYSIYGPKMKVIDYHFTEREIDENWGMLVRHAVKHLGLKPKNKSNKK